MMTDLITLALVVLGGANIADAVDGAYQRAAVDNCVTTWNLTLMLTQCAGGTALFVLAYRL